MRYDGVHCSETSETGDPRNQVLQLTSCPHVLELVKSFEVETWCVHGRLSKSNVLKYFKTGILGMELEIGHSSINSVYFVTSKMLTYLIVLFITKKDLGKFRSRDLKYFQIAILK